jgi:predicted membrane chloride channel (bestrophin family)
MPPWVPSLQLGSKEPFGLTSFALSLLLVFRTNARWGPGGEGKHGSWA